MAKRFFTLTLSLLLIVLCGCTPATKDVYEKYYELVEIPNDDLEDDELLEDDSFNSQGSDALSDKNIMHLKVEDFGAVGDGKTDDTEAIQKAVVAVSQCDNGSTLDFGKNKTYYMGSYPSQYAIALDNATGITINGNGSTILCEGLKRNLAVSHTTDCNVNGLNFDLRVRSHFVGTTETIDVENGYFDVVSDRNIEFDSEWTPSHSGTFCLKVVQNHASRSFLVVKKITTIDKSANKYRVYVNLGDTSLGTKTQLQSLSIGQQVLVPTPYIGHEGQHSFSIGGNTNFVLKNVNVYNYAYFGFAVNNNKGKLTFENVNVAPPADEKVMFCGWRDSFHCKTNSASIIWKDCALKGAGDDSINACSNMMYVAELFSKKDIRCVWPETQGSYGDVEPGSKIVIWDSESGELIGKANVVKTVSSEKNVYSLDRELPNLRKGQNIRVCFENHAAPNSQIINCDIDGTIRFKGPIVISNTKLSLIKMWINCETYLEGPIPHDILFENCQFDVYGGRDAFIISCDNPMGEWRDGLFKLENIVFKNCSGLTKDVFFNRSNFVKNSPDYVTITPPLTN